MEPLRAVTGIRLRPRALAESLGKRSPGLYGRRPQHDPDRPLNEPTERFQRPPSRRKKVAPVKRIVLSPDAAKAYEKLVEEREDRQRDYGRHLASDNKPK